MSSAVISCSGDWVSGSLNWWRKRTDLGGRRSEEVGLAIASVGSMNCWAFCTRLEMLNIAEGMIGVRPVQEE